MRVTDVEAHLLRAELGTPLFDARSRIAAREAVLVRVGTDAGASGWGEAACFGGAGALVVEAVRLLSRRVVGSPLQPRATARDLLRDTAHFGQRGPVVSAISGIEIALWDALGHAAGLPVSALLGSTPVAVPVYATTGFYRGRPDAPEPDAVDADGRAEQLARDLRAVDLDRVSGAKIKVGRFGVADDVRRAAVARAELGPGRLLVLDANNAWSSSEAARVADLVADLDVLFLEEPIPFGLVPDSAGLRARSRVAIGGYELEPTYDACERYIIGGAVDVIQPDATWSGGLAECVRIAELAHAHGVRTAPHNFSTAVGTAANYHAACVAGVRLLETDATSNPLLDLPLGPGWESAGGTLHLRAGTGLGVTVTEEWVGAHA